MIIIQKLLDNPGETAIMISKPTDYSFFPLKIADIKLNDGVAELKEDDVEQYGFTNEPDICKKLTENFHLMLELIEMAPNGVIIFK